MVTVMRKLRIIVNIYKCMFCHCFAVFFPWILINWVFPIILQFFVIFFACIKMYTFIYVERANINQKRFHVPKLCY